MRGEHRSHSIRPQMNSFLRTLVFLLVAASSLHADQVVISEIMYHPSGEQPEYIELTNITATPKDIVHWKLTDGVSYDFPGFNEGNAQAAFLHAYEQIVIASVDPDTFRQAYGLPAAIRVLGPWEGQLSDAGERVTVKDKNKTVVSTVRYNDRGLWPVGADGAGHSLIMLDLEAGTDNWRNWRLSSTPNGSPGTPEITQPEQPVGSPEVDLSVGVPIVQYGDDWKFQDQNQDLGTAWQDPDFDDSNWESGPGLFGFENSALPGPGIQTDLLDSANNADHITYYFRKEFMLEGDPSSASFTIDMIVDDGAFFYLNGEPVCGAGVNANADWKDEAGRTVGNAEEELAVASGGGNALRAGRNVLAAEAHQTNSNSSDMVFGARLNLAVPKSASVVINEVLPTLDDTGYIEFHNPTDAPIDLNGFTLTDDPSSLTKWTIGTSIIVPAGGLETIPFAGTGFQPADPLVVFISNPEGDVVSAIQASVPLDNRSLGRKPVGGSSWFLFTTPTPKEANASAGSGSLSLRLNEVHFDESGVDWVEFYNQGAASVSLEGLALSSLADHSDSVALSGEISAGEWLRVAVQFPLEGNGTLFVTDESGGVLQGKHFNRRDGFNSFQTFPDGSNEWYRDADGTPETANSPSVNRSIVINELMVDPPSNSRNAEFIELYNRGSQPVDLTGWDFSEGINFSFPNRSLAPGAYLVVAADASRFEGQDVVGDFDGSLSNRGELVRLEDANGNLVDQVDYRLGGDWPRLVNGAGSTLELIHPDMDNDFATAWQDSDETTKSEFTDFRIEGTYEQLAQRGSTSDYEELHLHLVGDSHIVLRNLVMQIENTPANRLINPDRLSTNGSGATGWLCQGTHWASHFQGNEFHLISDGRGDNRANRAELDVPALARGNLYTLTFQARWVSGKPRFIVQTWDHSFGGTYLVPIPEQLGTPGAANSRLATGPAPQVVTVRHSPAVPSASTPVRILAEVTGRSLLDHVEAVHRADTTSGDGPWSRAPMNDAGTDGDEVAGDGVYTATISDYQGAGSIAEFFVQAVGANGQTTQLPSGGEAQPGMWVVDNNSASSDLRSLRFVVSQHDMRAMTTNQGESSEFDFNFPRLSNHYYNMTFISNEEKIIYAGEIRKSGSAFLRSNNADLSKAKWKLPGDHYYRGRSKLALDNDAAGNNNRYHNRINRYWLYLLGQPVYEGEYVNVVVNNDNAGLREEIEPPGNDFLDRVFPDGSNGELYRIDDEWWFDDDWGRQGRDADLSYKGTDEAIRYHTEWMKRSRETEYDYSALTSMFKTVSQNNFTEEEINRIMDPDQMALYAAVRGYTGDWDSITLNRGKNAFLYRKPTDGRFMFLQWDSDLAFRNANETFIGNLASVRNYFGKPYIERLYQHYLTRLADEFAEDSPRLSAWFDAEEASSSSFVVNRNTYESWIDNRANRTNSEIGNGRNANFAITTGDNGAGTTSNNSYAITGTSPTSVYSVRVVGHPEATFRWTSGTGWTIEGLVLPEGDSSLTIEGVTREGTLMESRPFTVTKTGNTPPVAAIGSNPQSGNISLAQSLELSGSDSADPDGEELTFAWTVEPSSEAHLTNGDTAEASVTFDQPGLYTVTLSVTDAAEAVAVVTREFSVFAEGDFVSFTNGSRLPYALEALRATPLGNAPYDVSYSLETDPGWLSLSLPGTAARRLNDTMSEYPVIQRPVPTTGDFVLQTKLELSGVQLGDFYTGLTINTIDNGSAQRFAFGLEDGKSLAVKRGTSSFSNLGSQGYASGEAVLRIRRSGEMLSFEVQATADSQWLLVHSQTFTPETEVLMGGLFTSTDTAQPVRVSFDYLMVIDPANVSDLQRFLRVTEIMYHPPQGDAYEFIELQNIGDTAISLNGVTLQGGRPVQTLALGNVSLEPGAYTILAASAETLRAAYDPALPIAAEWGTGKLSNDGERIEILDANGRTILDFSYNDNTDWPSEADGLGNSLDVLDSQQDLSDPTNWSASALVGGTPAGFTLGEVPQPIDTDGDGLTDDQEAALSTNPNLADTDGDGLSDGLEVRLGTAPTDANSTFQVTAALTNADELNLTWPSNPGNNYTVEASEDLITWGTVESIDAAAGASETSTVISSDAANARYYRVRLDE